MFSFFRQLVLKTVYAFRGFKFVIQHELSFKLEVIIGLPIVAFFSYYFWPLERWELMGIVITYGLVLILELVNTSIERMLEKLHPEEHELIGQSKDVAAAAVLGALGLLLI